MFTDQGWSFLFAWRPDTNTQKVPYVRQTLGKDSVISEIVRSRVNARAEKAETAETDTIFNG